MSSNAITVLHRSADISVETTTMFPGFIYLVQEDFAGTFAVELNESDARALYLILKNRFEA